MSQALAKMYGFMISGIAAAGLPVNGLLFDITNTDFAFDVLRAGVAAYLIYAAFINGQQRVVNRALITVGILYIGIGIIGIISPTLGGLLPNGLTGFDITFHLLTGTLAALAAVRQNTNYAAG